MDVLVSGALYEKEETNNVPDCSNGAAPPEMVGFLVLGSVTERTNLPATYIVVSIFEPSAGTRLMRLL
jgi:hypothetical protein